MKKKKKNPVILCISILFVIYLALFITQRTGYYELKSHNEMLVTRENMAKFEKAVERGEDITISDYIETNKRDYTSKVSNLGNKTSSIIEKVMTEGIKKTTKVLARLLS